MFCGLADLVTGLGDLEILGDLGAPGVLGVPFSDLDLCKHSSLFKDFLHLYPPSSWMI